MLAVAIVQWDTGASPPTDHYHTKIKFKQNGKPLATKEHPEFMLPTASYCMGYDKDTRVESKSRFFVCDEDHRIYYQ